MDNMRQVSRTGIKHFGSIVGHIETHRIKPSATRCFLALISLAALTLLCFWLGLHFSTAGFLYLIIVVLLSCAGDIVLSIVTSIVAAGCLIYFFTPPIFSFRVDEPLLAISIIAFLATSLTISWLVLQVQRMSREALFTVNRKLVDAEERERSRIARELHDDLAQRLALLAVQLEQIKQGLPDSVSELHTHIGTLQKQSAQIANDVQAMSHELHSSKLEYLGVAGAIKGFCREFGDRQQLKIDFISRELPAAVSAEVSLCLFRVLQEALHNAAKHSGVRHFEVTLFAAEEAIHLLVHDSGVGFDPRTAMRNRGLGLTSMQERMKLVNGQLSIDSQPSGGTTVHAWVRVWNQQTEHSQGQLRRLLM